MLTAAQALHDIFQRVAAHKPETEKFIHVVRDDLGLVEGQEPEAIGVICRLLTKIRADIEQSPHQENLKEILRRQLTAFNPLVNFSQFHLDIKSAKANCLKPDNLLALLQIQMATAGTAAIPPLDDAIKEAVEALRDSWDELHRLELPKQVKDALAKRMNQVISALDHYYQYGPDGLEPLLEGLLGQLALQSKVTKPEAKSFYSKAVGALLKICGAVAVANKVYSETDTLVHNGNDIIGLLGEMSDKF